MKSSDHPPFWLMYEHHTQPRQAWWPEWAWNLRAKKRLDKIRSYAAATQKDFTHACCFWYQVKNIGFGIRDDWSTQMVDVPMASGWTAKYKLSKMDNNYGGTGLKTWVFEFQGYNNPKDAK